MSLCLNESEFSLTVSKGRLKACSELTCLKKCGGATTKADYRKSLAKSCSDTEQRVPPGKEEQGQSAKHSVADRNLERLSISGSHV